MKWLVALLGPLLLAACLESRPPDIPRSALVQPADLSGPFWSVSLEGSGQLPAVGRFEHGADGSLILAGGEEEEGHLPRFRLVELLPPDLYLMIADYDDDKVVYLLMERRGAGAWQESSIQPFGAGALGAARLAHAAAIAARHGLTLDGSDPDKVRIEGPVDGMAIPELFRDRAFLAALSTAPAQLYLAAPHEMAALPGDEARFAPGYPSVGLLVIGQGLPGARWVQPDGIAGRFQSVEIGMTPVLGSRMEVRRLADGRFEAKGPGATERFGLLPLDQVGDEFLAVFDGDVKAGDPPRPALSLSIVRKGEHGWSREAVMLRGTADQAGRMDLAREAMQPALAGRGLKLDGNILSGPVTAAVLQDLLRDGRFSAGLTAFREGRTQYARR